MVSIPSMNDMAKAFDDLLDANAEVLSDNPDPSRRKPESILINGKKHDAIIEEISTSEIPIGGGMTEGEQFRFKVRKREFSSLPEKGDTVKIRGRELEIVGPVVDRNGVELEVTVGDLSGGEQ